MNIPAPSTKTASTWAVVLAFAMVYLCWGTTYLAIKKGVQDEHLPPALFGGVRVTFAGLILLGFVAASGGTLRLARRDFLSLLVGGIILFAGGNGLLTLAETSVSSSVSAVLAATTPLWIALFEWIWPRGERLRARSWLGLALGLVGVLLLMAPKLSDLNSLLRDTGPLLVLGSAVSWAFGSVLLRHRGVAIDHLTAAGYQLFFGGACLALVGLASGEVARLPDTITPGAVAAFFWLLIFGSLVGFVSYNWLLGHVSATRVGTYAYVNPAVAVLIGWLDGEEMTWGIGAGIAVILAGVALVRGRR